MLKLYYDVIVIGGGPAGLASAISASKNGAEVLILERNHTLGGILQQCIHNGFGLHYFKEELTGPEYASRFIKEIENTNVKISLNTMVTEITKDKKVFGISAKEGYFEVSGGAIILAMGCRERSAGAIQLNGTRPSGVFTAGAAQKIVNLDGYLVGKKVAILGSGDIGLIMARRMTFEGAKVVGVFELMPFSSGLKRNIVQCLDDFNIPLRYNTTVTELVGEPRLKGIFVAEVDENLRPIASTKEFVECDTLLLSVGLIPETDLVYGLNLKTDTVTGGAIVNDKRQTSINGIFSAGNVLHVHDLVDNVSEEGEMAGKFAAEFAMNKTKEEKMYLATARGGVRYCLPQVITDGDGKMKLYFRVSSIFKNTKVCIKDSEGNILISKKFMVLAPGEMENLTIDKKLIKHDITIFTEGDGK